ncbi:hypothetical protein MSTO_56950 [Mycobacterium stomatepiae]|uniref:Uncharacterized protein n=1 Tax=Mycobacterium stomatepiae TaxID=470076 RepID=A0A7I7QHA6_9MYCO|nr:hypothetical protein MSTO_56950 [Mycobacterium stomatepiae]
MSDLNNKSHTGLDDTDTGPIGAPAQADPQHPHRPVIPHMIRLFAVPVLLGWLLVTVRPSLPSRSSVRRTRRRWHPWTRRR